MAANPPIGNNALEGVLGVVNVEFDGVALGKTTDTTALVTEEDNQDMFFQQDGTAPQDKVPTGMQYMCNVTFGQITTTLVEKMLRGTTKSGDGNSMKFGRNIYVSRRSLAKSMTLTRVDSEGVSSTDNNYKVNFYLASPEVTGEIQWGADVQRNLAVTFYIFYEETEKAYGYAGYATSVGLNPVT